MNALNTNFVVNNTVIFLTFTVRKVYQALCAVGILINTQAHLRCLILIPAQLYIFKTNYIYSV